MLRYETLHQRAHHIHLQFILARILQSVLRQGGSQAEAAQFFRDLSVDKLEHARTQAVFQVRDFAVALDLEAPAAHLLRRLFLFAKNVPSRHRPTSPPPPTCRGAERSMYEDMARS